eukprot:scaffold3114_cov114-Isochrysis_galbana.AAC.8
MFRLACQAALALAGGCLRLRALRMRVRCRTGVHVGVWELGGGRAFVTVAPSGWGKCVEFKVAKVTSCSGGGMEGDRGARGVRVLEGGSPQISARTPTPLSEPRCRPLRTRPWYNLGGGAWGLDHNGCDRWLASESFILLSFDLLNSLTASAQKGGRLGFVSIARMSWDEWVDVQMEAPPGAQKEPGHAWRLQLRAKEGQRLTFRALSLPSLMVGHVKLHGHAEGQRERDHAEVSHLNEIRVFFLHIRHYVARAAHAQRGT